MTSKEKLTSEEKMSSKDYVDKLDWQSAIAAATLELEENKTNAVASSLIKAKSYLHSGIARCFNPDKEGKHKEAVDDLSKAIAANPNNNEAYYYRAYAFYLDGDYEKAITDCWHINISQQRDELLGKIYTAMGNYHEAVKKFRRAIRWYNQETILPPPGLLDSYRDACKKMNSV